MVGGTQFVNCCSPVSAFFSAKLVPRAWLPDPDSFIWSSSFLCVCDAEAHSATHRLRFPLENPPGCFCRKMSRGWSLRVQMGLRSIKDTFGLNSK